MAILNKIWCVFAVRDELSLMFGAKDSDQHTPAIELMPSHTIHCALDRQIQAQSTSNTARADIAVCQIVKFDGAFGQIWTDSNSKCVQKRSCTPFFLLDFLASRSNNRQSQSTYTSRLLIGNDIKHALQKHQLKFLTNREPSPSAHTL